MIYQKTIKNSITCEGVGVHSGEVATVRIHPAPENHGIFFERVDSHAGLKIPATIENIRSGVHATTIGINGTRISTVEHLMAAFTGLNIDNALVQIDGPEVPILDGSAGPFVKMIREAGIEEQNAPRKWLVIKRPVQVRVNGSLGEIRPSREPSIHCSIDYDHPAIGFQARLARIQPEEFASEIAGARTYGFYDDYEKLKAAGLAKGGSLDNAVVIGSNGVMNEDGLRWDDECVRHKILDLVGDLSLCGHRIMGEVHAHRAGHTFNHQLVRAIMANPANFELCDATELEPLQPSTPPPRAAVAEARVY